MVVRRRVGSGLSGAGDFDGWSTTTNADGEQADVTPSIAVYGDAAEIPLLLGAVGDYDGDGNDEIACGYFNGATGLVGVIDLDTFSGVANTVDVGGGTGTALMASVAQKTGTSSPSFGVKVAAMDVDGSDELVFSTPRRFTTELLTMPTLTALRRQVASVVKSMCIKLLGTAVRLVHHR